MPSEKMQERAYEIGNETVNKLTEEFGKVSMEDFIDLLEGAIEPIQDQIVCTRDDIRRKGGSDDD